MFWLNIPASLKTAELDDFDLPALALAVCARAYAITQQHIASTEYHNASLTDTVMCGVVCGRKSKLVLTTRFA